MSNVRRSANPFSFSRGSDWITVGRDDALSEMSEQDLRESKKTSSTYREPFRSVGEVISGPESPATDTPQTSKVTVSSRTVKSVKIPPPVPRKPAKLRRHSSGGTDRKTASSNGASSGYEMVNPSNFHPAEEFQERAYTGGAGTATPSSVSQATKSLASNELMDSDAGTRVPSWEPLQPKK